MPETDLKIAGNESKPSYQIAKLYTGVSWNVSQMVLCSLTKTILRKMVNVGVIIEEARFPRETSARRFDDYHKLPLHVDIIMLTITFV